jgi:hypothetical protein
MSFYIFISFYIQIIFSSLQLKEHNVEAFRANIANFRRPNNSTGSSAEQESSSTVTSPPSSSRDWLKISGPCAVVIGIEVHEDILYVGFQGIGVHSYTMVCVHCKKF